MEKMRNTLRQLEAQNQELQRQSASLDGDLLAERAIKEQKMKVGRDFVLWTRKRSRRPLLLMLYC